jgi:hypothetical protein
LETESSSAVSKKKQKESQPPKVFHFATINKPIEDLQSKLEKDLKRESLTATDQKTGAGLLLMRIAVLFARHLYDSIRFLCSDEKTKGRRPEYVLAVPSITRTLQEILFTVMYIGEDFPARSDRYYKASWRERMDERGKYCNEHSNKAEWKPFLNKYQQALKEGIEQIKLTEEEGKKSQIIEHFHVGMRLLENMSKENLPFARWMDKWFYQETSAIAHFTPLGTHRIAPYLMYDMVPRPNTKQMAEESLKRFTAFYVIMSTSVVLSIASELEHLFSLGNRDQIVDIWEKMRIDSPDCEEVCTRRYDKLLKMR